MKIPFFTRSIFLDLVFQIESLPDYGNLYVFDGSSYTKIDASNIGTVTFSTSDNVYWAATQAQVSAVTSAGDNHAVSFLNNAGTSAASGEGGETWQGQIPLFRLL